MDGKQLTVGSLTETLRDAPPDMRVCLQLDFDDGTREIPGGSALDAYIDDSGVFVLLGKPWMLGTSPVEIEGDF